jgi:hypothetical protein
MPNPNGPSREEIEEWNQELQDKHDEWERRQMDLPGMEVKEPVQEEMFGRKDIG